MARAYMRARTRAYFSKVRMDRADWLALRLLAAYLAVIGGLAMIYLPAALIIGGVGYLALGVRRGWL